MNNSLSCALLFCGFLVTACGGLGDDQASVNGGQSDFDGITLVEVTIDSAKVQALTPGIPAAEDPTLPQALIGYVPGTEPNKLVVFCHGWTHDVRVSWVDHILRTVREDVAVVASNYRDNAMFPVGKGAQDTIAATLLAKERFPSIDTVYIFGVSMGGAVAATAIVESTYVTDDGASLYDYWVGAEPLSNYFESYTEASIALPAVASQMEHDSGGTPISAPQEYERRSAVMNTADMSLGGIRAVAFVNSVNDGLVPYNQVRELALATAASAIPTQLTTVLRNDPDQASGSRLSAAIIGFAGFDDPTDPTNLSGHGSEADANHPVIRTAFEYLNAMLDGTHSESIPYSETVLDEG